MKAKEIIRLYEDEEKLSGEEIFNLIHFYFIKKMKFLDMGIFGRGLFVEAKYTFPEISDYVLAKRYSRAYIKKASNLFGRLYSSFDGGAVSVFHPNPQTKYWKGYPLFYFSTSFDRVVDKSDDVFYIELSISFSNPIKYSSDFSIFERYEEFSTSVGRDDIYRLIDSMVKFIRLTPFGK